MNTAGAQKVQVPEIAAQVTYAMRIMGVSPIPRNYELFYEAYIGSNPKLTRELAALGTKASQEELDEIGARYFGHHHGETVIDGAQPGGNDTGLFSFFCCLQPTEERSHVEPDVFPPIPACRGLV